MDTRYQKTWALESVSPASIVANFFGYQFAKFQGEYTRSETGGIHSLKPTISPTNKALFSGWFSQLPVWWDMLVRSLEGLPEIQWLLLVPLKGGRWHIVPQLAVNTTYILPSGGLYATYHLLGEPETTIEKCPASRAASASRVFPRIAEFQALKEESNAIGEEMRSVKAERLKVPGKTGKMSVLGGSSHDL